MPRKPAFENPVRALREAVGMNQTRFAQEFGVSESLLQKIELGHRSISDDLAEAIMARFGMTVESLKRKHGQPTPVIVVEGRSIADAAKKWEKFFAFMGFALQTHKGRVVERVKVLAEAADEKDRINETCTTQLVLTLKLERWIDDTIRDMGLNSYVKSVSNDYEKRGKHISWNRLINPGFISAEIRDGHQSEFIDLLISPDGSDVTLGPPTASRGESKTS